MDERIERALDLAVRYGGIDGTLKASYQSPWLSYVWARFGRLKLS